MLIVTREIEGALKFKEEEVHGVLRMVSIMWDCCEDYSTNM